MSIKTKASIVVFDQGNTLLMDPFVAVMQLKKTQFCRICEDNGVVLSPEQIVSEWTMSNGRINYPYIGHFYQEEPIVQGALRNLGVKDHIAAILGLELLKEYRIGLRKVIEADPRTLEVRNTLRALQVKGKRLGVFSNDRSVALGFFLDIMGIKQFFEYIETSESIGIEKPDPRVFDHIIKFFAVQPKMIVYIGDDPIRDTEAAKMHGLTAIQYMVDKEVYNESWRNYSTKSSKQPDASVERFSDMLKVVE